MAIRVHQMHNANERRCDRTKIGKMLLRLFNAFVFVHVFTYLRLAIKLSRCFHAFEFHAKSRVVDHAEMRILSLIAEAKITVQPITSYNNEVCNGLIQLAFIRIVRAIRISVFNKIRQI